MTMNDRTFSHVHAHKLDAPERQIWLPASEVVDALDLKPGFTIADVGAGTGYFAIPMSRVVGPAGKVLAVDAQPEMLDILRKKLQDACVTNIECRDGEAEATGLAPDSCDLVLLANLWHELDHTPRVLAETRRILRSGGRVAILDWRPLVDQPPGPPLEHRISSMSVVEDLAIAGFKHPTNRLIGQYSYLVIAEK